MDNITHSLVGALIGQAGLKRRTGLAMPALIIGTNLPDVDFVTYFLEGNQHLALRRGITHGPIAWVLLPLLLAAALWWFDRWQGRRGTRPEGRLPVRFGWLYALGFIACLTHPALDWLNVYGVRLLEPFSDRWFYGDTLFIIDVWLWMGMGFAAWISLRREKRGENGRKPARTAIAVALGYTLTNYIISDAARSAIPRIDPTAEHGSLAIVSPPPLRFWQRETFVLEVSSSDGKDSMIGLVYHTGTWDPLIGYSPVAKIPGHPCGLVGVTRPARSEPFFFWTRAPFAERAPDGSVILRDARYYDPRARDRFSVALPQVRCEPL